jgi:PAS domain S-box-containing protein
MDAEDPRHDDPSRPRAGNSRPSLLEAIVDLHPGGVALPDWQRTLEALRVAEEELRQQNESLGEAQAALAAERSRYQQLFDLAPDGYLTTDLNGTIGEANRAAAHLLGVAPQLLVGQPLITYVTPTSQEGFVEMVGRLRRGVSVRGEEIWVRPRQGAALPVGVHAGAALGAGTAVRGLLWLLHDLTDYHAARERAVQAERLAAVGQTVTALAHESRNALQCSLACLRILALEVADRPAALGLIERIQRSQDRLQRIFEDLRSYAAPTGLKRTVCDLRAAWRDAWAELEEARRGRDCVLAEPPAGEPATCFADAFRVQQVFRNLFENALAAADGPVRVSLLARPAALNGREALAVVVADDGPGLGAEQLGRLFEPFFTTKTRGTGLGLAICRRIVEAHGGTIRAGNAPGGGAEVEIVLPRGEV